MPIEDIELIIVGEVGVEVEADTDVIGLAEIMIIEEIDLVIEEEKNPEIEEDIEKEA